MFVTNWISTTKIQKISEITNFFRHYFLSRTEVITVLCRKFHAAVLPYLEIIFVLFHGCKSKENKRENTINRCLQQTVTGHNGTHPDSCQKWLLSLWRQ